MSNQLTPLQIYLSPKKIAKFFGLVVLTLVLANIAVIISRYILGYPNLKGIVPLFLLRRENNIPSTYSSFALLFCSVVIGIIAIAKQQRKDRYTVHWQGLSLIFLYLSFDEAASLHELTSDLVRMVINTGGFLRHAWVIVGITFVSIFLVAYRKFIISLPAKTRNLFILAGTSYVGGVIAMEMIGGWYADGQGYDNLIYSLLTTIEETLEMLGIVIFIYALLEYMTSHLSSMQIHLQNKSPSKKLRYRNLNLTTA